MTMPLFRVPKVVPHQNRNEELFQQDALAVHNPDTGGEPCTIPTLRCIQPPGPPMATEQSTLQIGTVLSHQVPPA